MRNACECNDTRLQALKLLLALQSSASEDAKLHELWADAITTTNDHEQAFRHYKICTVLYAQKYKNLTESARCAKKAIFVAKTNNLKSIIPEDLMILEQMADHQ